MEESGIFMCWAALTDSLNDRELTVGMFGGGYFSKWVRGEHLGVGLICSQKNLESTGVGYFPSPSASLVYSLVCSIYH